MYYWPGNRPGISANIGSAANCGIADPIVIRIPYWDISFLFDFLTTCCLLKISLSRRRAPLPWSRQTRPRPSWTPPSGRSSLKTSTSSTYGRTTTPPSRTVPRRSNETSPTTWRPASSASTSRPTPARTRWSPGSSGSCGWRRRVTPELWTRRWRAAWSSALTALRGSSSRSRAPAKSMSPSTGYTTPSHVGGLNR